MKTFRQFLENVGLGAFMKIANANPNSPSAYMVAADALEEYGLHELAELVRKIESPQELGKLISDMLNAYSGNVITMHPKGGNAVVFEKSRPQTMPDGRLARDGYTLDNTGGIHKLSYFFNGADKNYPEWWVDKPVKQVSVNHEMVPKVVLNMLILDVIGKNLFKSNYRNLNMGLGWDYGQKH